MQRLGPGELTLAEIAAEAGVTAGALAQRFGSKRALLLALAESCHQISRRADLELRAEHRSPLAAVRAYAESCGIGFAGGGDGGSGPAYLQSPTDPIPRATGGAVCDPAEITPCLTGGARG